MEKYRNAEHLLDIRRREQPVLAFRPHAAARASQWFLENFPGRVLYAVKANDAPHVLRTLNDAGIRDFDVASLKELENVSALDGAAAHAMNPVKSRAFIRTAYFDHGVRTFSLDSQDELEKILEETGGAKDLTLMVRFACNSAFSEIPLENKFGISWHEAADLLCRTRQSAERLGLTFNVGSQAMSPEAYGHALRTTSQHIIHAGVVADVIDIGGGFPSVYPGLEPPALSSYMAEINDVFDQIAVGWHCELWAEPGRALVAESESLIVRVDARRGDTLYINDGSFGALYDAAHLDFVFPCRHIGKDSGASAALAAFSLYGPTCDSADFINGPFYLPADIAEDDHIEFGNLGAYGRVMAARFNGCGYYDEVELEDEPMLTAYDEGVSVAGQASSASEKA
ncbi:MAG: type III PLP-dependent enzyme [Hyphomicrobiales bacterium]|nr:type III PLP-dependent enzyme [Hyphomicrobiales bacterium]